MRDLLGTHITFAGRHSFFSHLPRSAQENTILQFNAIHTVEALQFHCSFPEILGQNRSYSFFEPLLRDDASPLQDMWLDLWKCRARLSTRLKRATVVLVITVSSRQSKVLLRGEWWSKFFRGVNGSFRGVNGNLPKVCWKLTDLCLFGHNLDPGTLWPYDLAHRRI